MNVTKVDQGIFHFNFKNQHDKIEMVCQDFSTKLIRDKLILKDVKPGVNYFWAPSPGNSSKSKLELGDFIIHINGEDSFYIKQNRPTEMFTVNNKLIDIYERIGQSNFNGYWEVFIDKFYESDLLKIEKGDIVLDIGANNGFFSLYALSRGSGKVYAVEPFIENIEKINKFKDFGDIEVINACISDETKKVFLSYDVSCSEISDGETEVNGINPNDLITKIGQIDFLKIDCEGCEKTFFDYISSENLKKINKISMEVHSLDIRNKIITILENNGFKIVLNTLFTDKLYKLQAKR